MRKPFKLFVVLIVVAVAGCPVSSDPALPVIESTSETTEPLSELVDRTLRENLAQRALDTEVHGAWQILHGALAYQRDFMVALAASFIAGVVVVGLVIFAYNGMIDNQFARNARLTAEIAEGWLPVFFMPSRVDLAFGDALKVGTSKRDPALPPLDIRSTAPTTKTDSASGQWSRTRVG